jgi:hypothetical protein
MSICFICSTELFQERTLNDKSACDRLARQTIQGLRMSLSKSGSKSFASPPPRQGTCIVERCAQMIETSCRGCREIDCPRCTIAAELRLAEARINAERDAELAELPPTNADLETLIDKIIENLCTEHATFGSALAEQWYNQRGLLKVTPAIVDHPKA